MSRIVAFLLVFCFSFGQTTFANENLTDGVQIAFKDFDFEDSGKVVDLKIKGKKDLSYLQFKTIIDPTHPNFRFHKGKVALIHCQRKSVNKTFRCLDIMYKKSLRDYANMVLGYYKDDVWKQMAKSDAEDIVYMVIYIVAVVAMISVGLTSTGGGLGAAMLIFGFMMLTPYLGLFGGEAFKKVFYSRLSKLIEEWRDSGFTSLKVSEARVGRLLKLFKNAKEWEYHKNAVY